MKAAWDEARRNWTQSTACSELITILGESACIPKTTRKIICFELGGLEDSHSNSPFPASDGLPERSAMTKHASALTMAAVLSQRLGLDHNPILAQDPAYSVVAKQLLMEVGIEVVGGHGALAFTHVDEETLVFSCNPNVPV